MVQKKRKSKRQTPRSRYKLQKKVKAQIRADKKLLKKQESKIPRHVLLTDEEKQIYDQQRIDNELRQKNAVVNTFEVKTDTQLVFENSDIIIEVLDIRDISRKHNIEKEHFVFLSKTDLVPQAFVNECLQKLGPHAFDERNLAQFISQFGNKKIGIVGCKSAGRNTLIHRLEGANVYKVVGTLDDVTDISSVLRGSIDIDKVDVVKYTDDVLSIIDKDDLALCYEIAEFKNAKEFLNLLIEKQKKVQKLIRFNIEDAAKRFLLDLFQGKMMWCVDISDDANKKIQFFFKF